MQYYPTSSTLSTIVTGRDSLEFQTRVFHIYLIVVRIYFPCKAYRSRKENPCPILECSEISLNILQYTLVEWSGAVMQPLIFQREPKRFSSDKIIPLEQMWLREENTHRSKLNYGVNLGNEISKTKIRGHQGPHRSGADSILPDQML